MVVWLIVIILLIIVAIWILIVKKNSLFKQNKELFLTQQELQRLLNFTKIQLQEIETKIKIKENEWAHKQELCQKGFEIYANKLLEEYNKREEEYNLACNNLNNSYSIMQDNILSTQKELDNLADIRAAAQRALVQEEKVNANQNFYCINIEPSVKNDIELLEGIRDRLSIGRVVGKLIWETYYRPIVKEKFPKIIGKPTACGIYKISNIKTNACYIGQSLDVYKRWCDHCKSAIIEKTKNKLYDAIREYGLDNFTFELLEECTAEQLNDREKYFIKMYDSYNYGYNSTIGNS